jgi:hypothetical protein
MAYAADQASDSVKSLQSLRCSNSESVRGIARTEPVKEMCVGAGARIAQELKKDFYGLDTWKDTPDSVMTVYFVSQNSFDIIAKKGLRDLSGEKEGMLKNLLVG